MKKTNQIIALLLAAVCMLSYTACTNTPPVETTPVESETVAEPVEEYIPAEYLLTYSDYEAAEKWLKENGGALIARLPE